MEFFKDFVAKDSVKSDKILVGSYRSFDTILQNLI